MEKRNPHTMGNGEKGVGIWSKRRKGDKRTPKKQEGLLVGVKRANSRPSNTSIRDLLVDEGSTESALEPLENTRV